MGCKVGMHLGNVGAPNVRHPQAADRGKNVQAKQRLVTVQRSRLALCFDVGAHEFIGESWPNARRVHRPGVQRRAP